MRLLVWWWCGLIVCRLPEGSASLHHLLGIQLRDAVVLSASSKHGMGIVSLKDDVENIRAVGDDCLIGYSGNSVLCEIIHNDLCAENRKQELLYGHSLTVKEVLQHCTALLTKRFRSTILQVEQELIGLLIAGWEEIVDENSNETVEKCPVLYWVNEFGEVKKVPYGAHGPLSSTLLSYCDRIQVELSKRENKSEGWKSVSMKEAGEKIEDLWNIAQQRSNIVMNRVQTKWLLPKNLTSDR